MAVTNHERVGKALEILNEGLRPFVERELKSTYQATWFEETKQCLAGTQTHLGKNAEDPAWDAASLLVVMWNQWNEVFKKTLGIAERSLVSELREIRNKWAHQRPFSTDDAYRALDSMQRLLVAVSAAKDAEELERQKSELLRLKFDEQARHEKRKAASTGIESQAIAGLKPWREVVTPHPDVASGRYQQAEFAADLWQVYKGHANDEYRNPVEFFRRTYLTAGLKDLLVRSLLRLTGERRRPGRRAANQLRRRENALHAGPLSFIFGHTQREHGRFGSFWLWRAARSAERGAWSGGAEERETGRAGEPDDRSQRAEV